MAKQDVLTEFEEKQYEEHTEAENEYYNKLYEEQVDAAMASYLEYFLKLFYDAKEKTLEEKRNEMYNVIKLVNTTHTCYEVYLNSKIGCVTILLTVPELWGDINASIFLSVHGKYRHANALLRRWLETFITALYFDSELKKYDQGTKKYKRTIKKRGEWFKDPDHQHFTGDGGIVHKLIDQDTDNNATQLLKKTTSHNRPSSFKKYVTDIFKKLSEYVHYDGNPLSEDKLTRDFVKYDKKLFEEWYDILNQINEICNILTLLKFPEITGSDSDVAVVNAIIERCEREDKKLNEVVDELIRKGLERE